MKKSALLIVLACIFQVMQAQQFMANYDDSKVPAYTLPDPLIFENGKKVTDKASWEKRRAELLSMFEKEMFGTSPAWKGTMNIEVLSEDKKALEGRAVMQQVRITLLNGERKLAFTLLVILPHSDRPVPVFLGYNFGGNHSVTDDPGIMITESWMRNDPDDGVTNNKASAAGRGKEASRWQAGELVSRGYGLVTLYYGDIDPDFDDGFKNGVHSLYGTKVTPGSWGSIAAWAWGLSRVMDWIEMVPAIDASKVIVIGHSRLGKTAMWAGAEDKRFAMVISNNSGCGGAALSKRIYGETVGSINRSFPHWFCDNFSKYNENEQELPFDQHELLALIAPRPVYVASAVEDQWADPKGEFLSCVSASPVYELLGMKSFQATELPPLNTPVKSSIGYHIRSGGHDVTLYDWQQYIDFADMHLKNGKH